MRFVFLWSCLLAANVLFAAGEFGLFLLSGGSFTPKNSLLRVTVVDVSIDAAGEWAAATIWFRQNNDTVVWTDVVLINFTRKEIIPLENRDFQPRNVALSVDESDVLSIWDVNTGTVTQSFSKMSDADEICDSFHVPWRESDPCGSCESLVNFCAESANRSGIVASPFRRGIPGFFPELSFARIPEFWSAKPYCGHLQSHQRSIAVSI